MPARKIRGSWWADFRHARTRYRKRSPVNTKAGASEYEVLLKMRLARGEAVDAPPKEEVQTLVVFAKAWTATYVATNNKPSTQRAKAYILSRHLLPALGEHRLDEIGPQEIEAYKAAKLASGLHPKTVNDHLAVLGKCLRIAEEWGHIQRVPQIRLLRPPVPEIDFLTTKESQRLLMDRSEPLWNGMILVASHAGLRLGELFALEWQDADVSRRSLTVARSYVNGVLGTPKSNKRRHIPMTRALCDFFARTHTDGPVFGLRAYSSASKAIARIARRRGLRRIGFHTLRHTFAATLVTAGVPLPAIQALLGHATISTTMRYSHLAPSALRGAVDAFDRFTGDQRPKLGNRWAQPRQLTQEPERIPAEAA